MSTLILSFMIGFMFLGSFAIFMMVLVLKHARLLSRPKAPASPRGKPYRLEDDPRYHRLIPSVVKAGTATRSWLENN